MAEASSSRRQDGGGDDDAAAEAGPEVRALAAAAARMEMLRKDNEQLIKVYEEDREFYSLERSATLEILADLERMLELETAGKDSLARELKELSAARLNESSSPSRLSALGNENAQSPSFTQTYSSPTGRTKTSSSASSPSPSPSSPRWTEEEIATKIAQAVEAAKAEAAQVLQESKQEAAEAVRAARSEAAEAAKAAEKAKTERETLKQEIDEWKSRAEKNRKWAESAEASGSRDLVAAQREIARLESQVQDLEIHLEQGVNERKLEVERWMEKVSNLQEKVALQRQFMMKAGYESAIDSQGHAPLANLTNNI